MNRMGLTKDHAVYRYMEYVVYTFVNIAIKTSYK